jgi:rod shape-determining protein MreC
VVELISSPGVRIAACLESEKRPISYQGGNNKMLSSAQGLVEYVPLDIFASDDKQLRLVTSGLGGVFPANLMVGFLSKVEPSTDGLFKTGTVQLDPRLAYVSEVAVLVPLKAQ